MRVEGSGMRCIRQASADHRSTTSNRQAPANPEKAEPPRLVNADSGSPGRFRLKQKSLLLMLAAVIVMRLSP